MMKPLSNGHFSMAVLMAAFCAPALFGQERRNGAPDDRSVQFIVGDYLESEGGQWDPDDSPLRGPFGIDFDSSETMYIVELASGRLLRLVGSGKVETLRDTHEKGYSGDGGPVSQAQFNGPHNCVVTSDDRLLIADSWNHCVRSVNLKTGIVETIAGTGAEGYSGDNASARSATFNYVMCIELDARRQTLHIADLKNRRVRNMDLASGSIQTVAGNGQTAKPTEGSLAKSSPLVDPRAVASDSSGNVYVLERGGHALRVVRNDGTIHTLAGTGKKGFRDGEAKLAQFASPKHICCDPHGAVYIADDVNGAIRKYDPATNRVSTILGRGFGDPRITLEHPHGVRWHKDSLYVVDTGHNRILRILVD